MLRDRRGVGVAEYALLLFIVLVVAAVTFKFIGGRVKHAGGKTEEQFAAQATGSGGGGGGKSGGGANGANAGQGAGNNAGQGGGGGNNTTAGGGGGGGGAAGTGKADNTATENGALEDAEEAQGRGIPLWKIIGGVFIILFAIGGYFAFRKQKSSG